MMWVALSLACPSTDLFSQVQAHEVRRFHGPTLPICSDGPTALVLSGGGARGLAHIGVIRALDALGFRPDFIVATSIGGHVAAPYAAGFTGEEIEEMVFGLPLQDAFPGYSPSLPEPLSHLPVAVVFRNRPGSKIGLYMPLAEQPVIARCLRQSLTGGRGGGPKYFSALTTPLHVVATDLESWKPVILSEGDLVEAILASSAIPFVLPAVEIDGRKLLDGGLTDNVPVRSARQLGAVRVIVSDVTERPERGGVDGESQIEIAGALLGALFVQDPPEAWPGDVWIRPELDGFPKLGFSRKQKAGIIQQGYRAGMEALESITCLPQLSSNPITGVFPTPGPPASVGFQAQVGRDSSTVHTDPGHAIREILVATPGFNPNPWRFMGLGGRYHHGNGPSAWVGMVDPNLFSGRATGSVLVSVGTRAQRAEFGVRGTTQLSSGVWPHFSTRIENQSLSQFGPAGGEMKAIVIQNASVTLGPEIRYVGGWTTRGGLQAFGWKSSTDSASASALGGTLLVEYGKPTGTNLRVGGVWTNAFTRLAAEGAWLRTVGSVRLSPGFRVGFGRHLPPHLTPPLGGEQGFPGLHLGEGRGTRELMMRLRADQSIRGPLRLRVELASGLVTAAGPSLPSDQWLLGARIGLGLDTSLGHIDVGYGLTDTGREALYLTIGD